MTRFHVPPTVFFCLFLAAQLCFAKECKQTTCGMSRVEYSNNVHDVCPLIVYLHEPTDYISVRCNDHTNLFQCYKLTNFYSNVTGISGRVFIDLEHRLTPGRLYYSFSTSRGHSEKINAMLLHVVKMPYGNYRVLKVYKFSCGDDIGGSWLDHCITSDPNDIIESDTEEHFLGFWSSDPDSSLQQYLWMYSKNTATVGMYVSSELYREPTVDDEFAVTSAVTMETWPALSAFIYFNAVARRPPCVCDNPACGGYGSCVPHLTSCQCHSGYELRSDAPGVCQECKDGTWGDKCLNNCSSHCVMANTKHCRKGSGQCICQTDYFGDSCELRKKECILLGCRIIGNGECGLVNGREACVCLRGFLMHEGVFCNPCKEGYWGLDCKSKCTCNENNIIPQTVCNHRTGKCFCKRSFEGQNCEKLIDFRTKYQKGCQKPFEIAVPPEELSLSRYSCGCTKQLTRWNDKCLDLGVEFIVQPNIPTHNDIVSFSLVFGFSSDYSETVSYQISIDDKLICDAIVWNQTEVGDDGILWKDKPADFKPHLENLSFPSVMLNFAWHFENAMAQIKFITLNPFMKNRTFTFDLRTTVRPADAIIPFTMLLKGTSKSLMDVSNSVTKPHAVTITVEFSDPKWPATGSDAHWRFWKVDQFSIGCKDLSYLEELFVVEKMTSDSFIHVDSIHLPSQGLVRVCNNLTVNHAAGQMIKNLCGYLRSNSAVTFQAIYRPYSILYHPIDKVLVLDVTEGYDEDSISETYPQLLRFIWTCEKPDGSSCSDIVNPSLNGLGILPRFWEFQGFTEDVGTSEERCFEQWSESVVSREFIQVAFQFRCYVPQGSYHYRVEVLFLEMAGIYENKRRPSVSKYHSRHRNSRIAFVAADTMSLETTKMVFSLDVIRELTSTSITSEKLTVYPLPAGSLETFIRCLSISCSCTNDLNTEKLLIFEAKCVGCGDNVLTYKWSMITRSLWHSSQLLSVSEVNAIGNIITIKKEALKETRKHRLLVEVTSGTHYGKAEYTFNIVEPPLQGTCKIHPQSGIAIIDTFQVQCYKYVSMSNTMLSYRVFAKTSLEDGLGSLIAYGYTSTLSNLIFPPGPKSDADITIEISDESGAYKRVQIPVRVFPFGVGDTTQIRHVRNTVEKMNSDTAFQTLGTSNTYAARAIALVTFLAADVKRNNGKLSSEHSQTRAGLLQYLGKIRRGNIDAHLQILPLVHKLLSLNITNSEMVYVVTIIDYISARVHLYVNPCDRSLPVIQMLTRTMDSALTVAVDLWTHIIQASEKIRARFERQFAEFVPALHASVMRCAAAVIKIINTNEVPFNQKEFASAYGAVWFNVHPKLVLKLFMETLNGDTFQISVNISSFSDMVKSLTILGLAMAASNENFYQFDSSIPSINMPILFVCLYERHRPTPLTPPELSEPADIFISIKHSPEEKQLWHYVHSNMIDPGTDELIPTGAEIFVKPTNMHDIVLWLNLSDPTVEAHVLVTMQISNIIRDTVYDSVWPQPGNTMRKIDHFLQDPLILLLPRRLEQRLKPTDGYYVTVKATSPPNPVDGNIVLKLSSLSANISCRTLNTTTLKWETGDCEVGSLSTLETAHCVCKKLNVVSANLSVHSLLVDLTKKPKKIPFYQNAVMVSMVVFLWLTYIVALYWAYYADSADFAMRAVTDLEDNNLDDTYMYLVSTVTGFWQNAGTTSRVYIYLDGSTDRTRVHQLRDNERRLFTPGAENWFLITTPKSIGTVESVVVTHSNSGSSPTWFLRHIYVLDVQTNAEWYCEYNEWIGEVEGLCVKVNAVSTSLMEGRYFYHTVRNFFQQLQSDHIWISIFAKSAYSNFTRAQRLTCAVNFLLSTMISSLIFLEEPEDEESQGPLYINVDSIINGFKTSVIIIPINILLVGLFTSISPDTPKHSFFRYLADVGRSRSSISKDLQGSLEEVTKDSQFSKYYRLSKRDSSEVVFRYEMAKILSQKEKGGGPRAVFYNKNQSAKAENEPSVSTDTEVPISVVSSQASESVTKTTTSTLSGTSTSKTSFLKCKACTILFAVIKGDFLLPWWFIYISWPISIIISIILSYFVMLYGLTMSYQGSFDWLLSFFTAVIQDAIINQTVEPLIKSFIFIYVLGGLFQLQVSEESRGIPFNREKKLLELARRKEVLEGIWKETKYQHPIPINTTREIPKRLKQKKELNKFLQDVSLYAIFFTLLVVSIYLKDNTYTISRVNYAIKKMFIEPTADPAVDPAFALNKVNTSDLMWSYLDNTLLPRTFATVDGATFNREHYLLGRVRVRQVRQIKQSSYCSIHAYSYSLRKRHQCIPPFTANLEDTASYISSWSAKYDLSDIRAKTQLNELYSSITMHLNGWIYKSAELLGEKESSAIFESYPGGGYAVDLPREPELASNILNILRKSEWVDYGTKVVQVKFVLYCANVNLISQVTIWFERGQFGRVFPSWHVHTMKLESLKNDNFQNVVLACEIGILFLACMHMYYLIRDLVVEGFVISIKDLWNWLDLLLVSLTFSGLGFYIQRLEAVNAYMSALKTDGNDKFNSLDAVQTPDEGLTIVSAVILFFTMMKLLKFLRYSRAFTLFSRTFMIAGRGITSFIIFGVIMVIAFSIIVYPKLSSVKGFKTWWDTVKTLTQRTIDAADLLEIMRVEPLWGSVFIFFYVVLFSSFIFGLFFVAINEAFRIARICIQLSFRTHHIVDYVMRQKDLMLGRKTKKKKRFRPQLILK